MNLTKFELQEKTCCIITGYESDKAHIKQLLQQHISDRNLRKMKPNGTERFNG